MRLKSIHAQNIEPIKKFDADNLSDVVVLAGPNGVGKSRFLDALVNHFRNLQPNKNFWVEVEATSVEEREAWEKDVLSTNELADCQKLRQRLQQRKRRSEQKGSLLFFESDRAIVNIQPYQFNWNMDDPSSELVGWDLGFSHLKNRFQDTIHSIFRQKRSRREAIAREVERLASAENAADVTLNMNAFPDPIIPFQEAFSQLLAPKSLLEPEAQKQQLSFSDGFNEYPIGQLSSGEREVVNIVFDFILRNPSDSIVIFDEPELHLHPELSYKLIQTLKNVGIRNQFILCTHSPDIITSALDNSVIFIRPADNEHSNQAIRVSEEDESHQALKLIGQSIGIISLGRKIVLIEGNHSSLDKQTYGSILKSQFPGIVMVPSEGRATIQSFGSVQEKVLSKSIWGVEFYMLCDRDAVPAHKDATDLENTANGKLRILPRYHLENYFLDAHVIASMFADWELEGSNLRNPSFIDASLRDVARSYLSYAAALIVSATLRERVGNVDLMPRGAHEMSGSQLMEAVKERAIKEAARANSILSDEAIECLVNETVSELSASLDGASEKWKLLIPGKHILKKFCSQHAKIDLGRFKTAYLKAAEGHPSEPFKDIIQIFGHFANS